MAGMPAHSRKQEEKFGGLVRICYICLRIGFPQPARPVRESKGKRVRIPYSSRCCKLLRLGRMSEAALLTTDPADREGAACGASQKTCRYGTLRTRPAANGLVRNKVYHDCIIWPYLGYLPPRVEGSAERRPFPAGGIAVPRCGARAHDRSVESGAHVETRRRALWMSRHERETRGVGADRCG